MLNSFHPRRRGGPLIAVVVAAALASGMAATNRANHDLISKMIQPSEVVAHAMSQ